MISGFFKVFLDILFHQTYHEKASTAPNSTFTQTRSISINPINSAGYKARPERSFAALASDLSEKTAWCTDHHTNRNNILGIFSGTICGCRTRDGSNRNKCPPTAHAQKATSRHDRYCNICLRQLLAAWIPRHHNEDIPRKPSDNEIREIFNDIEK